MIPEGRRGVIARRIAPAEAVAVVGISFHCIGEDGVCSDDKAIALDEDVVRNVAGCRRVGGVDEVVVTIGMI